MTNDSGHMRLMAVGASACAQGWLMLKSMRGLAENSGHHALNSEGSGMPRLDGGRSRTSCAQWGQAAAKKAVNSIVSGVSCYKSRE